jgi:hypothetical protein
MKLGRAKVPKASGLPWSSRQIDVLAQADRLQTDLANVRDDAPQAAVEATEGHIVKARDIAVGKLKPPTAFSIGSAGSASRQHGGSWSGLRKTRLPFDP